MPFAANTDIVDITGGAAAKFRLPGCDAVMLQLPCASSLNAAPVTEHVNGVKVENDTAKPDVAEPTSDIERPALPFTGREKLIDWDAGRMVSEIRWLPVAPPLSVTETLNS
jgi:hypothetical protein